MSGQDIAHSVQLPAQTHQNLHGKQKQMTHELGWTNNILFEKNKQDIIYYAPCYLRLKIKNFSHISFQTLSGEMNTVLIFTVYYGNLPRKLVKELYEGIVLQFNRNEAILLKESIQITVKNSAKQKCFTYTVRKFLTANLECNFFWSPFELIYLYLVVIVRSVSITHAREDDRQSYSEVVRFNLMNHQHLEVKISYTLEDKYASYQLAPAQLLAEYTNDLVSDPDDKTNMDEEINLTQQMEEADQSVKEFSRRSTLGMFREEEFHQLNYFQYATFTIPMFKKPIVAITSIFFPLWGMSIYNFFIFFQATSLDFRIANSVTLILTLYAFVPTIREQIPLTPEILLVQILIYCMVATYHLGLIQSFVVRDTDDIPFVWYHDAFFLICIVINVLTVVLVILMLAWHHFVWLPSYLKEYSSNKQYRERFSKQHWKNPSCDFYFSKFNSITIFK